MRILHVLGDSAFGGGSRVVIQLCEAARRAGHDPAVLTTDPTFLQHLAARDIRSVPLACICRPIHPWRDLIGERRLRRYLARERPDLIHTHTSKAGFLGRRAAWRAGVGSVVHTVHGFAFHEASHPLQVRAYAALETLAARWCHRLVTVSRFHRDWAIRLGIAPAERIIAIPNGIEPAPDLAVEEIAAVRRHFGVTGAELLLVSAGRLAPGKGLEDLLMALAPLRDRPWRLVLPGAGPLAAVLAELSGRLGLADRVVLPGFRDDVRRLLAAADLAVLPTYREGLSIALLEALAAGLPVVTTTIGSNLEVTRDGWAASLVPPGRPAALRSALVGLLDDRERRAELSRRAVAVFAKEYTESRMLAAYLELYAELDTPGS
ncbi:MAG: glycosyltransferase [Candidatus Krumholzibacteriia bacterium]